MCVTYLDRHRTLIQVRVCNYTQYFLTLDTGLRNDSGHSPLDTTNLYIHEDCLDVARYLIQRNGPATEEQMVWLMKGASYWGKLDLLNDLVGECIIYSAWGHLWLHGGHQGIIKAVVLR